MFSSHGQVNSKMMTVLVDFEKMKISGLRFEITIYGGMTRLLPKSFRIVQSGAKFKSPLLTFFFDALTVAPALTNAIESLDWLKTS